MLNTVKNELADVSCVTFCSDEAMIALNDRLGEGLTLETSAQ